MQSRSAPSTAAIVEALFALRPIVLALSLPLWSGCSFLFAEANDEQQNDAAPKPEADASEVEDEWRFLPLATGANARQVFLSLEPSTSDIHVLANRSLGYDVVTLDANNPEPSIPGAPVADCEVIDAAETVDSGPTLIRHCSGEFTLFSPSEHVLEGDDFALAANQGELGLLTADGSSVGFAQFGRANVPPTPVEIQNMEPGASLSAVHADGSFGYAFRITNQTYLVTDQQCMAGTTDDVRIAGLGDAFLGFLHNARSLSAINVADCTIATSVLENVDAFDVLSGSETIFVASSDGQELVLSEFDGALASPQIIHTSLAPITALRLVRIGDARGAIAFISSGNVFFGTGRLPN